MRRQHFRNALLVLAILPAFAKSQTSAHFTFRAQTGSNAVIAIPLVSNPNISGTVLENGDEVGAYTPSGLCVGATVWPSTDISLTVWGDDTQTPDVDGLASGEQVQFRVWSKRLDTEYPVSIVTFSQGDGSYVPDAILVVSSFTAFAPPSAPELLIPSNGSVDVASDVLFSWRPVEGAGHYRLQLARDSGFSTVVVDTPELAGTDFDMDGLMRSTEYFWRVLAVSDAGTGEWSAGFTFITTAVISPVHFVFVSGTGNNATIAVRKEIRPSIGAWGLEVGDEVGAFTPTGVCAGAIVWEDTNTALIVWGDDDQTAGIDGFEAGTQIGMRVWRKRTGFEYADVSVTYETGVGIYEPNSILVLVSLKANPVYTISVGDSSISFGPVATGQNLIRRLVFYNHAASSDSLLFGSIATATTVFEADAATARVAPSDSFAVNVSFTPVAAGSFVDTLVADDQDGLPIVLIPLNGSSPPPLLLPPAPEIGFGIVAVGDTLWRTLTLINGSINPLTVQMLSVSEPFSILWSGPAVIGGGDSATFDVAFHPAEFCEASGILQVESDGGNASISVSGSSPAPMLILSPTEIDFGSVASGDSAVLEIIITNNAVNPLVIDSVALAEGMFRVGAVLAAIGDGDTARIAVTFAPTQPGVYRDTLRIANNSSEPLFSVVLTGESPSPILTISVDDVSFGEVILDSTSTRFIVVSNHSLSPLLLTACSAEPPFSAVTTILPVTIGGNDSLTVAVSFLPSLYGGFADTLVILSDGGTAAVSLGGSSPLPTIVVDPALLDFGQVELDSSRHAAIRVTTTTINVLVLDSVFTSDGMFTANMVSGRVATHDTLDVVVDFHPTSFGNFADSLFLRSRSNNPELAIPLMGSSPAPVPAIDTTLLAFDQVAVGDSSMRMFHVSASASSNLLRVDSVSLSDTSYTLRTSLPCLVQDTAEFLVVYAPDAYVPIQADSLTLHTNVGTFVIRLLGGSPRPSLAADPMELDFGLWLVDSANTMSLRVTNSSINPCMVQYCFTTTRYFGVDSVELPFALTLQDTIAIGVFFEPDSLGPFIDTLWFVSDNPPDTMRVVLRGVGSPTTGVGEERPDVPLATELQQNFPNPFNGETIFGLRMSECGPVDLRIFDLLGREVAVVAHQEMPAGVHAARWNAATLPSGIYFARLQTGSVVQTRKMVLMK